RTLDVPAGPAWAPRAFPLWLAGLRRLPQGEVTGVPFALAHLDAGSRLELLRVAVAQFAVVRVFHDIEIHIPTRRVGVARVDQLLDDRLHGTNVLSRTRQVVDSGDTQLLQAFDV